MELLVVTLLYLPRLFHPFSTKPILAFFLHGPVLHELVWPKSKVCLFQILHNREHLCIP